jgi:hypothetical protein
VTLSVTVGVTITQASDRDCHGDIPANTRIMTIMAVMTMKERLAEVFGIAMSGK